MRNGQDLLYSIFEQHLFSALVEDETSAEFLDHVVGDYMTRLSRAALVPFEYFKSVESEVREEVQDMLRKKTYGHFSLTEFRKAQGLTAKGTSGSRRKRVS